MSVEERTGRISCGAGATLPPRKSSFDTLLPFAHKGNSPGLCSTMDTRKNVGACDGNNARTMPRNDSALSRGRKLTSRERRRLDANLFRVRYDYSRSRRLDKRFTPRFPRDTKNVRGLFKCSLNFYYIKYRIEFFTTSRYIKESSMLL